MGGMWQSKSLRNLFSAVLAWRVGGIKTTNGNAEDVTQWMRYEFGIWYIGKRSSIGHLTHGGLKPMEANRRLGNSEGFWCRWGEFGGFQLLSA